MYGENDATKVITIRISEKEYRELKEIAQKLDKRSYYRQTVSSTARKMIAYCLDNEKARFEK